jgi:hypothetical protein
MVYLTIEFLEVVLDVIGLCLCGITIIYLVRNKARFKKIFFEKRADDHRSTFDNALICQLLKQEPEKSFEAILNTIKKERLNIQGWNNAALKEDQNQIISNSNKERIDSENEEGSAVDLYGEVKRLADLGVAPKKISEKVSLPKSEIDLIINLKRKGYRSAA